MPGARAFGRQSRSVVRACPSPGAAGRLSRAGPGGAWGGGRLCAAGRLTPPPSLPLSPQPRRPASRRCRRRRGPARTPATTAARLASGHNPARPRAALPRSLTPGLGGGSSSASRSNSHWAGMAGTRPWLRAPPAGSGDVVDRGLGGGAATTARHQRRNGGHGADWATATPPFPAL